MKQHFLSLLGSTVMAAGLLVTDFSASGAETNPFLGDWALTIPDGGAGWLGVTHEQGFYDASILWGVGSVVPAASVFFNDKMDTLFVSRINEVKRKDASGKVIRTQQFTEAITAKVTGDQLSLTRIIARENGEGIIREEFTGTRIPPMPPAPDLSKVKFGEPIKLFNGQDLAGWKLTNPNHVKGWSAQDGLLMNRPIKESGKAHVSYGNLQTEKEFEDFNLTLEARVNKGGNSGIYLRGIYEVQVADTYGRKLDPHNMGAIYSRVTPSEAAEKPAGEWQQFDITLVDRHVTVILNGKRIIDNAPLRGCTGGALWSDVMRPGPIYLQGDHEAVDYRNIELRPVIK